MLDSFIQLLEEQYDFKKRADTRFKTKSQVIQCKIIQEKYAEIEYIKIEKLKSKLDYI